MAVSMEELSGGIDKLTTENYNQWKFNMKMALVGRDLFEIVEGSEVLGADASEAKKVAFKKRENKAMAMICLSIAPSLQIYVRNTKSAKEAWDSLANKFEEKTLYFGYIGNP